MSTESISPEQLAAIQAQYGYQNQDFSEKIDSDILRQADPVHVANQIKHALLGEEMNEEGVWVKVRDRPLINDDGLASVLVDIRELLSQNTTLSHLEEEQIGLLTISLSDAIISKLAMKYKEWKISKAELTTVHDVVVKPIYLALRRAYRMNEKNWFKKSLSATETKLVGSPSTEKRGFLNFLRKK